MFFWNKKNKKEKPQAVVVTDQNFEELVANEDTAILLDFWAPWCGPCKIVGPVIDELSGDFADKNVVVGKVNVDQNPNLAGFFKIKSIPTLMFIKNRQVMGSYSGMVPKPNLAEMLNDLIDMEVPDAELPQDETKEEEE